MLNCLEQPGKSSSPESSQLMGCTEKAEAVPTFKNEQMEKIKNSQATLIQNIPRSTNL